MEIEFPGFVDLQINGFAGVDFNTPGCTLDELEHANSAIRATGVTRYLPTLITSSLESFQDCVGAILKYSDPAIAGIHMEGPYISPQDGARGAHPREFAREACIDDFSRRQEAAGDRIVLVTLAPEVPGALRLIEHLVDASIRVAIGHTAATAEQIRNAVSAGCTLSTHLGNGCSQHLPRHPNFIWEQLAADELLASFIADGHHLPGATVKTMVRAKTPSRSILVTDAISAAGCRPGIYRIGGAEVQLDAGGRVSAPGALNMAGSSLTMPTAVANTARFTGLPIEEVLPMASTLPAHYLGIATAGRVSADWDSESYRLKLQGVHI